MLLFALAVLPFLGLTLCTSVDQRHLAVSKVQEAALRLARLASTEQGKLMLGTRQLLVGLAQLREVRQRDSAACNAVFDRRVIRSAASCLQTSPRARPCGIQPTQRKFSRR